MTATPWDDWAGTDGDHLTPQARELAALAGSSWSFDTASARLKKLCGLQLSDHLIRRVSDETGRQAMTWQQEAPQAVEAFRQAAGHGEFYTDGVKVNTRGGWREMRLNVFAKRPEGEPATVEDWDKRVLPDTTARVAFGSITPCEALGPQWADMARRLGLEHGRDTHVLGDGAKWIWGQAEEHLPKADQTVDIYHVSEHLHGCARVLHGEGTPASREWAEAQRASLMTTGPICYLKSLEQDRRARRGRRHRASMQALLDYLTPNVDRLWYQPRLARGLPIGSGLVEGACKTVVGRRLKLNSARWHADRADHMAANCCLLYSSQWEQFWARPAAKPP